MRKNATKIAAVVMSLALTLTSVNIPTSTASAASKAKLSATKATLYVSGPSSQKSTKLKVTVNGKKKSATFTSSNTKVAKVNKNGKVTAKKKGKATIKATYNGKTYKCKVTVKKYKYVTSVSVDTDSVSLAVGETQKVAATVAPAKATVTTLKYTSSDKTVAKVNQKGKITAVAAGTATITVKATDGSNKKATIAVTVTSASSDDSTATTAPSEETATASPDAEETETPAEEAALGEITSLTATAADTLTAVFSATVPDTTTVTVSSSSTEISGTTTINGDTVTFVAGTKFSAGTYTLTATSGDASVSADVEVLDQYVAEITILDTVVLTGKSSSWESGNDDEAYVYYDVLDQYGESMRTSETINWTTSPNYSANDTATGMLTVQQDGGFTYGSSIFITGVHVGSGTSVSTSVTVGASQAVDSISFEGFLSKNDKTKILETLPADFAASTYVLLYKAYDQNSHEMDVTKEDSDGNALTSYITFINDNPTLIDSSMTADEVYTIGEEQYASIAVEPGLYVDKGGEVNITAISNKTGTKTVKNYVIGSTPILSSFVLSSPSGTVCDGDQGVSIPFTATDTDGNEITNYESIVRSTNTLSLTSSVGTLTLYENADGTASLYWYDAVSAYDYDGTASGMTSTYDGQARSIALTTIVVGGTSDNLMLSVSDMRYPAGISSVSYSTTVVSKDTGSAKVSDGSITFTDQYGETMGASAASSFFTYAADNTFNSYYYGLQATASDTNLLSDTTVVTTGGTISWTAADVDTNATASVKYSIVKSSDLDSWTTTCSAKTVTSTIVNIGQVKNVAVNMWNNNVRIETEMSEYSSGKTMDSSMENTQVDAAGVLYYGWHYVTGTYNGTTVTIPSSYYDYDYDNSAIYGWDIDYAAPYFGITNSALTWGDLYDFDTYGNPRKTATVKLVLSVAGSYNSDDGLGDYSSYSTKLTVTDSPKDPVNISFWTNSTSADNTVYDLTSKVGFSTSDDLGQWVANIGSEGSIGEVTYTYTISDIVESTSDLTHMSNSFTVSNNGTYYPSISGAEIGDSFKLTIELSNGITYETTITLGADTYANISSASTNGNLDKELRATLGYNR